MTFPVFASGEVLTAADMNAVGLWLVKTQTFSASTRIEVDNVFTSTYTNYLCLFEISASTVGAGALTYQMNASGTPASGSYTSVGQYYSVSADVQTNTDIGTGRQGDPEGFCGAYGTNSATGLFTISISAPNVARSTVLWWSGGAINTGTSLTSGSGGSIHYVATAYNGIDFIPTVGALTGTMRMYGYRD